MTVSELIEFLKTQDQSLTVAYEIYSEWAVMKTEEIAVEELTEARPDGWIQRYRDDLPTRRYLVFPGN